MGNVIVPRASGKKSEAEQAIQIYYEENDWLTNADFIQRYKAQFGPIGKDNDNTAYTKRTQIGAYFGFIEWEDIGNNKSRRRITPRGRVFWEHILANDTDAIHEDLMKSLEEVSFGRRNYACPSGDTDIEPPAVFFHAALELEYITNDEFACLLCLLDSENKPFDQAVEYIRNIRREKKSITLPPEYQKNDDPKPLVVLGEWGVLQKIRVGRYSPHKISEQFIQRFDSRIRGLKLWNTAKSGPIPVKSALVSIADEYSNRAIINDDEAITDSVYQDLVNSASPSKTTYTPEPYVPKYPDGKDQKSSRPHTNPSLGKEAIRDGKYKCTIDSSHTTFAKTDGTTYMEVHHLIPLKFQCNYTNKLDTKANLIPVCPLCHKRLHYGRTEDITPILTQLYNLRHNVLQQSGLRVSLDELIGFYK